MSSSHCLILSLILLCCGLTMSVAVAEEEQQPTVQEAHALYVEGRYREALTAYRAILLHSDDSQDINQDRDRQLAQAYAAAVQCFGHLDTWEDFDSFVDAVMAAHSPRHWRLGQMVLHSLVDTPHHLPLAIGRWRSGQVPRYGTIIDGEIRRGQHGDQWVNIFERDRVRALRYGETLLPHLLAADSPEAAAVLLSLADAWGEHPQGDWALQTSTDLESLPVSEPVQPVRHRGHYQGEEYRGAPVDADGAPITYALVEDYADASNDGERWRWLLHAAAQRGAEQRAALSRARMAERWFSVATLGQQWLNDHADIADARWQVATLGDDETIARLASGIQRFSLPDAYNYIRLYQEAESWHALAQIYEQRNQRQRAAETWLLAGNHRRHEAIVKPWLRLEAVPAQVAGETAQLPLQFRNADSAQITVQQVRLHALAQHIQARARNPQPDYAHWQYFFFNQLHRHILEDSDERWLSATLAQWDEALEPAADHQDALHHLNIPVSDAGAYWVTAEAADGNVSRALLWLVDTVVVHMPINQQRLDNARQHLFFVADAASGEAVPDLTLHGFGHRGSRHHRRNDDEDAITVRSLEVTSNHQGLIEMEFAQDDNIHGFTWFFTSDDQQRLAMWEGAMHWHPRRPHPQQLRAQRAQVFTDRPLYRPDSRVAGRVWAMQASYAEDHQPLMNQHRLSLIIHNPQGDEIHRETYRSDRWGGFSFAHDLGEDAALGEYQIMVHKRGRRIGHGRFRVEEYRPPEFSVTVDAPTQPVLLGDTIRARVSAGYLWGQPVRQAEVRYTVTRRPQTETWFPSAPWDWLYGRGYWWHWRIAPVIYRQAPGRPEVVAQGQAHLDAEGGFDLAIDTSLAQALYGDRNQHYSIEVEVRDASRRTEVGQGQVIASAEAFHLRAWTRGGYLRAGRDTTVQLAAQRADGQGIAAAISARLYGRSYGDDGAVHEELVHAWQQELDPQGRGQQRLNLARPGQYRLQVVAEDQGQSVRTSHLITVVDHGLPQTDPANFRFTALEVLPDQDTYAPGDQAQVLITSAAPDATVLLFVRPEHGTYFALPEILRLRHGAVLHTIDLNASDQPNIFVEAISVHDGQMHRVVQQLLLPPRQRHLDMTVEAESQRMAPGEDGTIRLQVRDADGQAVSGSAVVRIYDSALDLLAGDMHPSPARETFWQWTRRHYSRVGHSIPPGRGDLRRSGEEPWVRLGQVSPPRSRLLQTGGAFFALGAGGSREEARMPAATADGVVARSMRGSGASMGLSADATGEAGQPAYTPTLRQDFADSILWSGAVTLDEDGQARLPFTLSDSLTTWRVRVAAIADGAAVGEASTEIVAAKDLMLRLHAPRFATETDRFVLSTSIHNDHPHAASLRFRLNVDGNALEILEESERKIQLAAGGQKRLDIPVRALAQGQATITATVVGQVNGRDDGDALTRSIPIHIYGAETTEVASLVMAADQQQGHLVLNVPEQRIPEASQLTLRWSPTVAGAAIEAIPYLADYPYGCTEQTLNRFVPAVIAMRLLQEMDIDLQAVRKRRASLNPGQLGNPQERDQQHRRHRHNPVFDPHEIDSMVAQGVTRLQEMQLSDGGWGWFSGYSERSWPHTTAVVVRGLILARDHGATVPESMLESGLAWLQRHQQGVVARLQGAEKPKREQASNIDALIALIRQEAGSDDASQSAMVDFLVRDRLEISVYSQALLGLTLQHRGRNEEVSTVLTSIGQFVEYNDDNHTAWLRLRSPWWRWYGAEFEAMSAYLNLLVASEHDAELAQRVAKYLVNSRRGNRWNSTRDTAWAVEALAGYARISGEMDPDLRLRISVDGSQQVEQHITRETLWSQQSSLILGPEDLPAGSRRITIEKVGEGPLYVNAWLSVFTREAEMTAHGEEVQIQRTVWRIAEESRAGQQRGGHGQVVDVQETDEQRTRLETGATIHSGDLLEIELIIESANDYEYLMITDPKFAGSEPVEQRSGYYGGAFVEFRDDRVVHFLRSLPRGTRSLRYRVRAELPGTLNAMPAVISGMYAPELIGNSHNWRIQVEDASE
ncbi:MAG: hypothetical protein EA401_03275 [Planctomycetota bacterium]|nr:MAG: hypothetical protein EA401_03275 [Planctomycetota bacterium]